MSNRLSREEWNQLDSLLGKHGFGGYYDLIEMLKMAMGELGIGNTGIELNGIGAVKLDLFDTVQLLYQWARKLRITEGFQELVEKASEKEE